MISLAFWILTAAVAIGVVMAIRYAGRERLMASRLAPSLHGLFAACGFLLLAIGLTDGAPAPDDRYGTGGFGPAAAALAAVALVIGFIVTLRGRAPGRRVGFLIGTHATVAVIAYVLLLAFYWMS